jgi:hypothetical protein
VKKKDCQEEKHIGTSYNLVLKWWWEGLLRFQRMVEDPIEELDMPL